MSILLKGNLLEEVKFTKEDVETKMNNLNINHERTSIYATPENTLHPIFLKRGSGPMSMPLSRIFQSSMNKGEIPSDWQIGRLLPVFTKGDPTQVYNYLLISRTNAPCKIMERIIRDNISAYIETNKLLNSNQLCTTFTDIENLLNRYDCVRTNYFDCKKACATVPHKSLIDTLKAYGISGVLLKWIETFLSNMTQRVSMEDSDEEVLSDPFQVNPGCGFPADSILGPFIFMLYLNDLLQGIRSGGILSLTAEESKNFKLWFKRL